MATTLEQKRATTGVRDRRKKGAAASFTNDTKTVKPIGGQPRETHPARRTNGSDGLLLEREVRQRLRPRERLDDGGRRATAIELSPAENDDRWDDAKEAMPYSQPKKATSAGNGPILSEGVHFKRDRIGDPSFPKQQMCRREWGRNSARRKTRTAPRFLSLSRPQRLERDQFWEEKFDLGRRCEVRDFDPLWSTELGRDGRLGHLLFFPFFLIKMVLGQVIILKS